MKSSLLKKLIKIVNIILMVGTLYFAYIYGSSLLHRADFSSLGNNLWGILAAFIFFIFFYVVLSLHWLAVCRVINSKVGTIQALAYFASQPFKYLPSSLFSFSFRAKYAKKLGMSIKDSTYAQLAENVNILGSGLVVSILFLIASKTILLGIICLGIYTMLLYIINKRKVQIELPFLKNNRTLSIYKFIPSFALMSVAWVISGISFWLVSNSLNYTIDINLAICANAAAFVASILAVFAPGGIGVRELVLSLFLIQNSVIVIWRILTFVVDMLVGSIAVVYIAVQSRNKL